MHHVKRFAPRVCCVLTAWLLLAASACRLTIPGDEPQPDGSTSPDALPPTDGQLPPDGGFVCDPVSPGDDPFHANLMGWWSLDQSTGDDSGNGHDCVAVGSANLVQDAERGGVLELSGGGAHLDCGNGAALDPSQALTLSLWVRVRSFDVPWQSFLSRNGEQCGWNLRRDENNAGADFALRGTTATDDLRGTRPLNDGAWHHIAGVFDNTRRVLYVDGEVDTELLDTGPVPTCAADHVIIGAMGSETDGYGHDSHNGWVDDVRIYNAALDAEAIRRLAGLGNTAHSPTPTNDARGADPSTVLRWEPGLGACRHHVYLGYNAAVVAAAQDPWVHPGRGELDVAQFDPGPLDVATTYYWRVDEVTADGIQPGTVWSFRTGLETDGDFVRVPAGTFTMGASPGDPKATEVQTHWGFIIEKPHTVTLTRDFWMKTTEVTNAEWFAAMGDDPGVFTACGPDCPIENITWKQMIQYCNQRSIQEGLTPCYWADAAGTIPYGGGDLHWVGGLDCEGYRMPTEAEWEYAARAGTTTQVFNGDATHANVAQIAWYAENSQCSYPGCELENGRLRADVGFLPPSGVHPVAQKLPNDWGLYDTAGNVWEFVWDEWGEYPNDPVVDPVGPWIWHRAWHVARGGSWMNGHFGCGEFRVSARDGDDSTADPEDGPGPHTGFRIARTAQ